jgi:hypothetical protein
MIASLQLNTPNPNNKVTKALNGDTLAIAYFRQAVRHKSEIYIPKPTVLSDQL